MLITTVTRHKTRRTRQEFLADSSVCMRKMSFDQSHINAEQKSEFIKALSEYMLTIIPWSKASSGSLKRTLHLVESFSSEAFSFSLAQALFFKIDTKPSEGNLYRKI